MSLIADWQFNILRDSFLVAIFITLTGFVLHNINFIIINVMYSGTIIYLSVMDQASYVSNNAVFLTLTMAGFSFGIYFFRDRFWKSINENHKLTLQVNSGKQEMLKQEANLINEKALRLQENINHKNRELASNAIVVAQNAEVRNRLSAIIDSLVNVIDEKSVVELNSLLSQISTSQNSKHWEEFQIRFNEVHQNFYKNITILYPKLSPADKKIAAFIKLGMSSKEISLLTQNTKDSVDVARYRLRKKMNLAKSDNLSSILSKI
ncbi:hypothetical protein HNS38_17820 [Lentimicrobium sp. L6]|uniref:helix-turn-helix transcriptional regulator n=1 Tax=Lentimicrobium sp. L6 TaxID=2735916 RepID=UPI00155300AF|nr:hypothetical protein [Lentimicrobium sp. L6]NPD86630.1 hypothetical protein [Lentimicrobium sp. L6]